MNKVKIILDTQSDVTEFVSIANTINEAVFLEDGKHFRANAKSLMGVMYGKFEFDELWVMSDCDQLSNKFRRFMI